MTRYEIMAMTPEQLRIAIAEAKGWIDNRQFCENEFLGPDNEWYYLESDYHGDKLLPDWPTDISAAWELVEEMNGDGLWQLSNGDGDSIDFRFTNFSTVDKDGFLTVKENIFSSSDTAPLAIARAWLLYKQNAT